MRGMTMAILALVAMPALASAQDTTQRDTTRRDTTHQQLDSARTNMQQQSPQRPGASEFGRAGGRRSARGSSMGLTRDQVMQLQTALSGAGCDAGTADGILGPKTRRAMACARQKNSVTTNAELYRSLNLDFESTTSGREPSRGAHERSTEMPAVKATHGDSAEVGGRNRGRIRPPATDSARKPMGARDTTQRDTTSH